MSSAKSIKLFVDAHAFDTEYQGTQTFIKELYACLLANYPDVDVYWGAHHTERIQAVFPQVKSQNLLRYKKQGGGLSRFLFDIPRHLQAHDFDFAHFQYLTPLKQGRCQYIVTLHDVLYNTFPEDFSWKYRTSRNFLFGRSIKNAAIKTTVSPYSQQSIAQQHNIPARQIHVIPNGVNTSLAQHYKTRDEAAKHVQQKFGISNFMLYVSRVEPRKNHALLLEKWLKLKLYEQGIVLVFIGVESVATERLQQLIAGLTGQQRASFFWLKDITEPDLAAFYTACRLFVYPSKAEGFGIPPLEAAVCDAPVLCSSTTAMSGFDFFEPYTFNPADEQDFEDKLDLMIHHPPPAGFTAQVAQTVAQNYQWQHSGALFYNLLKSHQQA